jgi:hypothetical protein
MHGLENNFNLAKFRPWVKKSDEKSQKFASANPKDDKNKKNF